MSDLLQLNSSHATATRREIGRGSATNQWLKNPAALLVYLALAKLFLHFLTNGGYGYFRDELYYLACGEHLAWGYVDQPPLIAVVAWVSRHLLGGSLFAIRFFPALAGALVVFLTGWMAREMGGGRFAQWFAALAILLAPAYLAFDTFLSMNAFEPLFWMVCAWLVIRILKGADRRLWLVFGLVAGIGLLNKHTMLVFGFAIFCGLLLTSARSQFCGKWIWIAGLLALAIFLPNLIWEARHHWPQIEVVRNAQRFKDVPIPPLKFLWQLVLFLEPFAAPVWIAGLVWLLGSKQGAKYRSLGVAFLVILAIFMGLHGKTYYPLPAYPMLMAAGGVAIEDYFRPPPRRWARLAYPALLVLAGLVTLPFGVPILPLNAFIRYSRAVPLARGVRAERDATEQLPQLYADMLGWRRMVSEVAEVYRSLPVEGRQGCAILAGNYGEAAAIDFFGGKYGLPRAISGHNNYYLWGPRDYSGDVVIALGVPLAKLKAMFGDVEQAGLIICPHAMPVENNVSIYICRKPRAPLRQLWPMVRMYI